MRRVLLVLVLAFAATALTASAASANSATPTCDGGLCTDWFNHSVSLQWVIDPSPPTTATGCGDETITAEGTNHRECDVTWDSGDPSSANIPVDVKIDLTPPSFTVSPGPDQNGWYNHTATLTVSGATDPLSGVASCSDPPTYSGPDGASLNIGGGCTDNVGNHQAVVINYDATAPQITSAAPDRPADHNDWYNHPVGVSLQATDATSGLADCSGPAYAGPDSATALIHGVCVDNAGNSASSDVPFKYDATPPVVTGAAADRAPDHDGWYNHPVTFSFQGTDATSGVASCATTSYSGPVDATAAVNGACTDEAGNIGLGTQRFKYDDTRPAAAQVQVTPGNRRVDLSWTLPKDASNVSVSRSQQGSSAAPVVVYSGASSSFLDTGLSNGVKYRYAVTDSDPAGNSSTRVVPAIPTASSLRPFVGTVVNSPPLLTWKKIKRARYYNVQLFFGKKKVLSIWPRKPSLQLKQRWHFRGKTYTLVPGHYRWYVWPGFGSRAAHDYGNRIGRSSFRLVGS